MIKPYFKPHGLWLDDGFAESAGRPTWSGEALSRLREIIEQHNFSIAAGDLTYLNNG